MLNKTNLRQRMVIYFLLLLSAAFALTPILWMASISVRQNVEIFRIPPALLPPTFTLEAFKTIFTTPHYLNMFFNSYLVGTCVTLVSILLATLAGYGFSRYALRGGRVLQLFIIGTQMLPPVSLIVPYFILISTLNLYDTYPGLIVTHTAFVLPFATLMLTSYFNTIPQDLEEAAMIDGCSRVGALWRVLMPVMVPGVIATGIYCLAEITLLVEKTHSNYWNSQVAGRLEIITRQNSETPRVYRQSLTKSILHAEIGYF